MPSTERHVVGGDLQMADRGLEHGRIVDCRRKEGLNEKSEQKKNLGNEDQKIKPH